MFSPNINLIGRVSILEHAVRGLPMASKRGKVRFCEPLKHERSDAIYTTLVTVL